MTLSVGVTISRSEQAVIRGQRIAGTSMSIAFSLLFVLFAGPPQDLPHAFPREGAKQLIDNQRVTVWEVILQKGRPAPMHRHMYDMVSLDLADATFGNISADKRARTAAVRVGQLIWNGKGMTQGEVATGDVSRRTIVIDFNVNQISFGLTRFNARNRVHSEELVKGSARAMIFELK
jgi:hypothetical protein